MSKLAQQLIAENKAKHARGEDASYLDLGNCSLETLPDISDMEWLEELVVANEWWDWDTGKSMISRNQGDPNRLESPRLGYLPVGLKKLVWCGDWSNNWPTDDLQFLGPLTTLVSLDLSSNSINDIELLAQKTNQLKLSFDNNQSIEFGTFSQFGILTKLNLSNNRIRNATPLSQLTTLTKLYISNNRIGDVSFLGNLTGLTSLNLNNNQISDGSFLGKLTGLTSLDLFNNRISDGSFLGNLTGLISLNLSSNKIIDWSFLENLTELTSLSLWSNKISAGSFLGNLTGLTSLNLNNNQISDGSFLENLTELTSLDLSYNQINDVSFLDNMTKLTSLDLSYNEISNVRFWGNLPTLTSLNFGFNRVSNIRFLENLTGLNRIILTENQISDLAPLRYFLEEKGMQVVWREWYETRDGEIDVQENPLTKPPVEIVQQGNEAILNYFKQIEEQGGTAPLYEAKLIIVGEPDAGKTTLFEILKNPQHVVPNPQDKTTTGVKVEEGWQFSHPALPEAIQFSANLWDFGGQEIQYMTHQFFLTARSLYIILTDDRRENANMAYWFSAAHLFGRDDNGRQSPILVALNSKEFKSASKFDFDLHRFQSDYEGLQIEERRFDFATEGGYGRADLIAKIQEMLVLLPHVGDPLPRRWPEVRESLRERGKEVNHINEEEFCRICTEKGIPTREDQFYLSRYLHDLGSILHFQNDPELRDFIILNPSWAVAAVYSVLENKKVVKAEGMFDDGFLDEVWGKNYSRPEQSNLLRLMKRERFEVCFELSGERGKYLAPQLLSPGRPDFAWPKKGLLRFHFQYQFLPKGIVTRLHVRKHEMVAIDESGKRLAWDKGVVFQQDGCRAVVEERELKDRRKIIEISVEGAVAKNKIFLLNLLRKEIEAIHKKWFPKVTFEQMVPCCCSDCVQQEQPNFYEFSELLKYERKNEKFIKCSKSEDLLEVSVSELLDGVFSEEELFEYRTRSRREKEGEHHHYHGTTYVFNDKSKIENMSTNTPDGTPSNDASNIYSYLAAVVVIGAVLLSAINVLPWGKSLIFGALLILLLVLVGAFQLKNDKKLTEKSFVDLMLMILNKIPPLNWFGRK